MNVIENDDFIIQIPCSGKTKMHWQTLFVYEDRLVMQNDDTNEVIFDEKYSDMISLNHRYTSKALKAAMVLEMKNGKKHNVILDTNHTLAGKRVNWFNPEISQLSDTLPGFVNKLIAKNQ